MIRQLARRRHLWVLLLAVAAVTACRKASPPQSAPTPEPVGTTPQTAEAQRAKLQGAWRYLSFELNGKKLSPAVVREYLHRFDGTRYSNARKGQVQSEGSFSIDPSKSPARLDLAESSGVTVYGIYRLDGDRLTVCLHEKLRPTTFEPPPGRGYILFVMERDKPLQTEFPASSLTPEHSAAAKELQGQWAIVAFYGNGVYTPVEPGREVPSSFEGNMQVTVNLFNVRQEIEYRLDPTKTPRRFDQRFTGGAMGPWVAEGIYKLEGDTLTICYGGPKVARPDEFTTYPGDGRMMLVLNRVK